MNGNRFNSETDRMDEIRLLVKMRKFVTVCKSRPNVLLHSVQACFATFLGIFHCVGIWNFFRVWFE